MAICINGESKSYISEIMNIFFSFKRFNTIFIMIPLSTSLKSIAPSAIHVRFGNVREKMATLQKNIRERGSSESRNLIRFLYRTPVVK